MDPLDYIFSTKQGLWILSLISLCSGVRKGLLHGQSGILYSVDLKKVEPFLQMDSQKKSIPCYSLFFLQIWEG